MRVYLVRHGESEGNRDGKFRGKADYPLTENGKRQAREVGEYLKSINSNIKVIYTSPMLRAYDTAKIIADIIGVKFMKDKGFDNMDIGIWEGQKKEYIKKHFPKEWEIWINNPEELKIEGMETIESVKNRVVKRMNELKEEHKDDTICVVTHRAILKPLVSGLIGIKSPFFWKIHIDNAALSVMEYRDKRGWILKQLNVNHYLQDFTEEIV